MANTGNAAKTTTAKTTQAAKPAAAKTSSRRGGANRFTPADLTGVTADSGKTGGKAEEPKVEEAQDVVDDTAREEAAGETEVIPEQQEAAPKPGNGVAHREDPAPPPAPTAAPVFAFTGAPVQGHPQQDVPIQPAGAFLPPPPPSDIGFSLRPETAVLGLRTAKDRVAWWTRTNQITLGYYALPEGVIPEIAAAMVVANYHEIVREAVRRVHGYDIGPAPKPPQQPGR